MSILTALYAVSEKLGVSARTNNITEQINAINDSIGADHGINAEDAIINYARSMAQITPLESGADVSPKLSDATIFGHLVSTLQSDVEITNNKITGKLYQCSEGRLPDYWGPGYWLCLDFSNFPTGTTACLTGLKPSYGSGYGDVYEDSDHDCAFKVENPAEQKIKIITTVGNQNITETFDLSGIQLIPAEEG